MGKNLEINSEIEKYIEELSYNLHPIQKEIIKYIYFFDNYIFGSFTSSL